MAYKFQRGLAKLSGSITAEEGFDAGNEKLQNVSEISNEGGNVKIELSGTNNPDAFSIHDDSTLMLKVDTQNTRTQFHRELRMNEAIKATFRGADQFIHSNATNEMTISANAEVNIQNNGNDRFIVGNHVSIADGAIDFDIASHDGFNGLKLGGTLVTADAGEINFLDGATSDNNTASKAVILDGSGDLTLAGNLTVQGTTTSIDSTTINISSSFTFEGPADDFETVLHAGTPTQDITVYLPQYSASAGAHNAYLPVLADAPTAASALVTAAEFALLDGDSSVSTTTVVDGDAVLFNDGGTMKHMNVTSLKTYFQSGVTADTADGFVYNTYGTGSSAQSLGGTAGFYGVSSDDGTSSNAITLDLSGSWSNGNVVIIKAPSNAGTNNVTVRASGSGGDADTIDGESSILLESDNAAVTLVYAGGNWSII